eukprot:1161407-Pelagomonas_calceolata.AAC.2
MRTAVKPARPAGLASSSAAAAAAEGRNSRGGLAHAPHDFDPPFPCAPTPATSHSCSNSSMTPAGNGACHGSSGSSSVALFGGGRRVGDGGGGDGGGDSSDAASWSCVGGAAGAAAAREARRQAQASKQGTAQSAGSMGSGDADGVKQQQQNRAAVQPLLEHLRRMGMPIDVQAPKAEPPHRHLPIHAHSHQQQQQPSAAQPLLDHLRGMTTDMRTAVKPAAPHARLHSKEDTSAAAAPTAAATSAERAATAQEPPPSFGGGWLRAQEGHHTRHPPPGGSSQVGFTWCTRSAKQRLGFRVCMVACTGGAPHEATPSGVCRACDAGASSQNERVAAVPGRREQGAITGHNGNTTGHENLACLQKNRAQEARWDGSGGVEKKGGWATALASAGAVPSVWAM